MTQLLQNQRRQKQLSQVSYKEFQQTLVTSAARRIKNKRNSTVVYDNKNRLLAMLKNASIDAFGRCQPAQYFIC